MGILGVPRAFCHAIGATPVAKYFLPPRCRHAFGQVARAHPPPVVCGVQRVSPSSDITMWHYPSFVLERACNAPLQEQSWENAVSGAVANSTMWHFPGFALERACNAPLQERSWAKCRLGCSRKHYEIAFSQFCPGAPGCTGVPGCPGARVPGRGPGGARRCPEVLPGTPGAFLKLRASEDRSSSSLSWGPRGADGRGADLVFGRAGHAALMDDLLCTLPSPFFSSPSALARNS